MKDIYVLITRPDCGMVRRIYAIADDHDRASMEMTKYTAAEQHFMHVENHDLLEEGD
jgi:hypothetical protein